MAKAHKALASLALLLVPFLGPAEGTEQVQSRAQTQAQRPNIVFVLTDDQDAASIRHMPLLNSNLMDEGITFKNAFVTNSLCCPARATILRGQYTHNHGIEGNSLPSGGFRRFRKLGRERSTVATWLDSEGYQTALVGKYLNEYKIRHVPPGWDKWYGITKYGYEDFELNENGRLVSYKNGRDYSTDVLARKARGFVGHASDRTAPFFLYVAPYAPHEPATPAGRHEDEFSNAKLPTPPSFNEDDVSDKPGWVRDQPRISDRRKRSLRNLHRNRLRSLQAVDEMVGGLVKTLRANGELDNTYIVFTSDHGYHMGQHRLPEGKWTAYEEDIRVPLVVRGPGVPRSQTRQHTVLNNDFAPTSTKPAGAAAPGFVDGRSLAPLLSGNPPPASGWRSAFLVEAKTSTQHPEYRAVRTEDHLYVEYGTGERELYDLRDDPYQLRSRHADPDLGALRESLKARLEALDGCAGEECRVAEE